jgi:hypothetical protein
MDAAAHARHVEKAFTSSSTNSLVHHTLTKPCLAVLPPFQTAAKRRTCVATRMRREKRTNKRNFLDALPSEADGVAFALRFLEPSMASRSPHPNPAKWPAVPPVTSSSFPRTEDILSVSKQFNTPCARLCGCLSTSHTQTALALQESEFSTERQDTLTLNSVFLLSYDNSFSITLASHTNFLQL